MRLYSVTFKDIDIDTLEMKAHVRLSQFGGRFQKAQTWLDKQVSIRMTPFVPRKTGDFLRRIQNYNSSRIGTGVIVVAVPPQGKKLYPGVSKSGKPYKWSNPETQPYWGQYTMQTYGKELNEGVKRIILGKDARNG